MQPRLKFVCKKHHTNEVTWFHISANINTKQSPYNEVGIFWYSRTRLSLHDVINPWNPFPEDRARVQVHQQCTPQIKVSTELSGTIGG